MVPFPCPESLSSVRRAATCGSLVAVAVVAVFGLALSGCQGNPSPSAPAAPGASAAGAGVGPRDADKLLVVDCLLPGQVRTLGGTTYLAPRRPIRTVASECDIRGGEYTRYDRADLRTARLVWLPRAREGDPEAQVYLGEIYEKGLGVAPDHAVAAAWYRKAALQGNSRGAINLGYLYEKGLGVPKDLAEALNWYRKASGLSGDELQFASNIQATEQKLGELEQQLSYSRQESAELKRRLDGYRREIDSREQALKRSEQEVEALRRRLDAGSPVPGKEGEARRLRRERETIAALAQTLREKEQALAREREALTRLRAEAERSRQTMQAVREEQRKLAAAPPAIEILDPPIALTRSGELTVQLRSVTRERSLVGRVSAPAGLLSLTINDRREQPDADGIFQSAIPVAEQKTPVSVVAVDRKGRRASIDFSLVPKLRRAEVRPPAPPAEERRLPGIDFGRYHALVIGNNNYRHFPRLQSAVNDARALERVLRERYGFRTTLLIDADRYQILSALNDLRERLTQQDNLLVFYAGHGELDRVNRRGHWLPVDAEPDNSANWISNIAVTDILNVIAARHVLVVADSCYSGALTRSSMARIAPATRGGIRVKWVKVMNRTRSRTVLTSGGLKPVLDTGSGGHSVFAKVFLQVLENNDAILDGYRLYRSLFDDVRRAAARYDVRQEPLYAPIKYAGHESGEFFFVPKSVSL